MKIDNSGINKEDLIEYLNGCYDVKFTDIRFIPAGEEGYCYRVTTDKKDDYFIKAQNNQSRGYLEKIFSLLLRLHYNYRLDFIVPAIPQKSGLFVGQYGNYSITLFNFIEGNSLWAADLSDQYLNENAEMIASLHQVPVKEFQELPGELYENPFAMTILKLYKSIGNNNFVNGFSQEIAELFIQEKDDVMEAIMKMGELKNHLLNQELYFVITHGDPNFANIIKNRDGELFLIDWGEISLGPVERDLMAYTENDFAEFLKTYVAHNKNVEFNLKAFEFYLYHWCLQEIAEFGERLLRQSLPEIEVGHAKNELKQYLPFPHEEIVTKLEEIELAINKY